MIDKGPGDAKTTCFLGSTASAGAAFFHCTEVIAIRTLSEIEHPTGSDSIAEASSPRGPDTVEHVGAQGDGNDKILRVTHTHYIAWFWVRELIRTEVDP